MDRYHLWFDLRPDVPDLDLAESVRAYLDHLQGLGRLESWSLCRRKLGFGPDALGEFHVEIRTRDMAQLETAFQEVARREGRTESLHAAVWSRVRGLRTALYRDFPDRGGDVGG